MNNHATALPATTDILVIGYGPVGAALAVLLGRYGVNTLVVDKAADIHLQPRAIALDNEALRILQMLGLTESDLERIGIPEVKMHSPFLGQFARVNTSGSIDGHPKLVTFYQPDLERALRCQVAWLPSVKACPGYELMDLRQDNNGVTATLKDRTGGLHEVAARYLVGADGATSKVRHLIGQDFKGKTYSEDWLIVDALKREKEAIDHVEFICDPARPTPHMPAPGGRERWEFMLKRNETREAMERPEKLAELLRPWVDSAQLTIERHAVYRFHARCCASFQKDRVFLAGDAAHITPPFVGQGLVAGLRDVANLGWKLAWVLSGQATPKLLDSYDQERRPHAKKMIAMAQGIGRLIMPKSAASAVVIHGAMRAIGYLPFLRRQLEELEIKPANRFKRGFFVPARSPSKLRHGSQLPQGLVRESERICLSDDVLGEQLTLVGFGVNPSQLLDDATRTRWQAQKGNFLQLGMRGQQPGAAVAFAEDMTDALVPGVAQNWLAVIRPDRVILHDGPATDAVRIANESLQLLNA